MTDIPLGVAAAAATDARSAVRLKFIDNIRWSMIILVLTMHAEPLYASRALQAGAAAFFQKLIRDSPREPRNYVGLGTAQMGLQQYDAAIAAFREATKVDPKSLAPRFALGQAQLKAGRFADAKATFQYLVDEFPNDPRARAALDLASRQAR